MALSTLTIDDVRWALDRDILAKCGKDYGQVAYESQKVASGRDGTIRVDNPWVLTSSSTDFGAIGVTTGRVVRITAEPSTAGQREFGTEEYAEVDSVAGHAITLRRPGEDDTGTGKPYTTAETLTQLTFAIFTFDPQTKRATSEIREELRELGLTDAEIAAGLSDATLRKLVMARVLREAYENRSEGRTDAGQPDKWAEHARKLETQATMLMDDAEDVLTGQGEAAAGLSVGAIDLGGPWPYTTSEFG